MPHGFSREVICFGLYAVSTFLPRWRAWVIMASLSVAAEGIKLQCFAQIWWWWGREEQRLTGLWRQLLGVLAQAALCSESEGTVCAEQETCLETYPHYSFSWQYLVLFSKCKFSSIRSCGSVSWAQRQVRVFGGVLTSSLPKDHLRSWSCPPEHIVSHPCCLSPNTFLFWLLTFLISSAISQNLISWTIRL